MSAVGARAGLELPVLRKEPVSRVMLAKYACASGDFSPHHLDPEVARSQGLDDVVAHGMLSLGYLGQLVSAWAGAENIRRVQGRFRALVQLGDGLTCHGIVTAVDPVADGRRLARLAVWAENQRGEMVTTGEAEVYLATSPHPS